jgi:MATE family multidrug resistance protein
MQNNRQNFWTEIKRTTLLAGPVIGSQLGQMSMGFVDTVMVGRLGAEELAGVALGNTLFFFLLIVCLGVVMAVAPIVSQAYGAGEHETIERSVRQGFLVAVLLAVVPVTLIWNIGPLLLVIGQRPETVELTVGYLRAISFGFLPFLWFAVLRGFVEGISRPLPVTLITLMGLGMNILANYVLMFG